MLPRKILSTLENWKIQPTRKPLIIRGARQVGKTTVIDEFGKTYTHYIKLNLEKADHAKFFTNFGDNVSTIYNALALEFDLPELPSQVLLFIDEIQQEPKAIALLRYFYEELPELQVIAAGSLLEFAMGDVLSFPVGRVIQLPLYPLDFEEFLMALDESKVLELYKAVPQPDYAFNKLLSLFNEYTIIGGMPEVVATYVQNGKQMVGLSSVYASIWDNYRDDIEKYGKNDTAKKVLRHIIATAPNVRDRITFNGFGSSQFGSREVSEAFRNLHKAGIIKLIYPTSDMVAPIIPNLKRKPKIQFLDTGLLNYASNIQLELMSIQDLNNMYRGYIINHVVFQELISQSNRIHDVPCFWTRESTNANAEIDAIVNYKNMLIPIELKAGKKGSLKSLHEFMDRSNHSYSFRLLANKFSIEKSTTKSGKEFSIINLPYYTIGRINEWIAYIISLEINE